VTTSWGGGVPCAAARISAAPASCSGCRRHRPRRTVTGRRRRPDATLGTRGGPHSSDEQGNAEGTAARPRASTRVHARHSSSADSSGLRDLRGRRDPRVPSVPSLELNGKEGVSGSSPEEGLKYLQIGLARCLFRRQPGGRHGGGHRPARLHGLSRVPSGSCRMEGTLREHGRGGLRASGKRSASPSARRQLDGGAVIPLTRV
jgi:hypothetical protein